MFNDNKTQQTQPEIYFISANNTDIKKRKTIGLHYTETIKEIVTGINFEHHFEILQLRQPFIWCNCIHCYPYNHRNRYRTDSPCWHHFPRIVEPVAHDTGQN